MAYTLLKNTYNLPHELPKIDKHAFEGKEMELTARLHWLDYGPRRYDPATTFWTSPDPLSSLRPDVSPYAYCAANPVANIDPSGERIVYAYDENEYVCVEDGTGNYYFNHETLGRLDETFGNLLATAINKICSKPIGKFFLDILVNAEEDVYVKKSNNGKNYFSNSSNTVYWSSTDVAHGLSLINGEYKFTGKPFTALLHEFSHAIDKLTGDYDSGIWFENKGVTIKNNEQVACFRENLIRQEQGLPRRDFYGVIQNGTSVRPILMSFIKDRPIDVIKFNISYNLYKLCQKVLFFSR